MNNDDNRKRKATQVPDTSSRKQKTNTAMTSRITLDASTRPATRSISKIQSTYTNKVHSRDPSPGASQSADTHRTRSKTGFLKSTKRFRSPSEGRTLQSNGGLSQWDAEMQRGKLDIVNDQSSPRTSHTKKRSKALPRLPPKPEEIIAISSDDNEDTRPRKRLKRRHTTQVSEIIDLTKDENPSPRTRPSRLRPAPSSTPTTVTNLSTSASSSSPVKHFDFRRFSCKSKPKTPPPHSQSQSQIQTRSCSLRKKLPPASSSAKMRRQLPNDKFDENEERNSSAYQLPAVEAIINKPDASPSTRARTKPGQSPKIESEHEPQHNQISTNVKAVTVRSVFEAWKGESSQKSRMFLSKELRVRLQDEEEEEEEESVTSLPPPLTSTSTNRTTNAVSEDADIDAKSAKVVLKTEDIEDAHADHQLSIPTLVEGENLVVVKEKPQFEEPSSVVDQESPLIPEQERNDLEETVVQSMLVASAMDAGVPLADEEDGIGGEDGLPTISMISSTSVPINDTSTVRDLAHPGTQVTSGEVAERREEADNGGVVTAKDSEVEKMPDEVVPERPLRPPTADIDPYLDYKFEQQEQTDLEEALFQSQLYSPLVSRWEDEDRSAVEEQEQDRDQFEDQVDVTAPAPTGNLNAYEEDVFVTEDADDTSLTTNETTLPVSVITRNDVTKTKGNEAMDSLTKFSIPLQAAAACPFSCSVPTTTFPRFVPTESIGGVVMAGELTQRFFAQSCLPPKARTWTAKPAEEVKKLVTEVQMAEAVVEMPLGEAQEKVLTEVLMMQSEVEQVQNVVGDMLVQSEETQSPVGEVQVEKPVEEVPVWSGTDEMQMPATPDVDVGQCEVEVGAAEQQAEAECEEGNEDEVEEEAVVIPPSGDDDDTEIAAWPERDSEVLASRASEVSGDQDMVAREIQDVPMIPVSVLRDDTVLQASEDDVKTRVALGVEDEVTRAKTTFVVSPQTTEVIDTVKSTPAQGLNQTTTEGNTMTIETFEKNPMLSLAMHGSRVLLEIIQGVINQSKHEPEATVQVEETDGGHSPHFQTSTPEPEALLPLEDHDAPILLDDEPHFPQNLTSEPLLQLEDTEDDACRRSTDVSPSSLLVVEELTLEPLVEVKDSGDAPRHRAVLSSVHAQTPTPEPFTHEIKDGTLAPSEPFEDTRSSHLQMAILTLEPLALTDEVGEDIVAGGDLENVSQDQLPLPSIYNSSFQSHRHLPVEDEGQSCGAQSTILTGDIPPTTVLHRRTMSNAGSRSSLATLDDSPLPSTPPQSAFEAYYIRSTTPDDGLDLDIFSKLTDIPYSPLPQSDEEDDEYLLSLEFSYPDFDIAR